MVLSQRSLSASARPVEGNSAKGSRLTTHPTRNDHKHSGGHEDWMWLWVKSRVLDLMTLEGMTYQPTMTQGSEAPGVFTTNQPMATMALWQDRPYDGTTPAAVTSDARWRNEAPPEPTPGGRFRSAKRPSQPLPTPKTMLLHGCTWILHMLKLQ